MLEVELELERRDAAWSHWARGAPLPSSPMLSFRGGEGSGMCCVRIIRCWRSLRDTISLGLLLLLLASEHVGELGAAGVEAARVGEEEAAAEEQAAQVGDEAVGVGEEAARAVEEEVAARVGEEEEALDGEARVGEKPAGEKPAGED